MVKTDTLAKELEDKLNTALSESELNSLFVGAEFKFRILNDTSEYKNAERIDNKVIYYIHGLMEVSGSDKEGVNEQSTNITVSARVEFLIPFVDKSDSGVSIMTAQVRDIIDRALEASEADYKEYDGILYYCGAQYSVAEPGERDVRPKVGDSITLEVYIEYFLVASGVSSEKIRLEINGKTINPTRIGMHRKTITDGNIPSDADGSTKNAPEGSAITVSFDAPYRLGGDFVEALARYVIHGEIEPLEVTLRLPITKDSYVMKSCKMVFSEVGVNGELNLAASESVTLIEYFG